MKAVKVLYVFVLSLLSNAVVSQNDTMYVVQGDSVIGRHAISSYDSIVFYDPTGLDTRMIKDIDGNIYTSVTIGTQEWMAQNLRTTKYTDGNLIPNVTSNSSWRNLSTAAWCNFNNKSKYDSTYGKLYNWYAVETDKLCPTGWHVPTDQEWTELTDYLASDGHRHMEGQALKSRTNWDPNVNGSDRYGWNGLPGGSRFDSGFFSSMGVYGYWWTSSELNSSVSWERHLDGYPYDPVYRGYKDKKKGFSVRCLRSDSSTSIQSDYVYLVKGDSVLSVYVNTDIDSIIFYNPNPIDTTSSSDTTSTSSITDSDGNTYTSVTIGTQEWMVENLRTTKYSDGTTIPNVTDDDEWANDTTGAWCHYDNDHQYDTTYGKLYNWYAVETGKLCPKGWHVPTEVEWTMLTDYLAADGHELAEGKVLKSTSGWYEDGSGTDDYGWNGLPGGFRSTNYFRFIGLTGYWWSSLEHDTSRAWFHDITSYFSGLSSSYISKNIGFSVRCLRGNDGTDTTSQDGTDTTSHDVTDTTYQVRLENGETPLSIYQSGVPIDSIIGKTYQGGIIAYLDTLDGTGLIAAPHDQSRLRWGCSETTILGAVGIAIGTGKQNTADIIAGCSSTNTASYYCDTLTIGRYKDWFLPSKDELNKLYENIGQGNALGLGNVGGFSSSHYWSSSQYNYFSAWSQYFYFGSQNNNKSKSSYHFSSVRAVRYF